MMTSKFMKNSVFKKIYGLGNITSESEEVPFHFFDNILVLS